MKKWIWLALLGCTSVQADMLDALKAYEGKNYIAAQQQFAELLPLGNELAAFNLGVMAYQAEGQEKDLIKALAYFMLAAELKHPTAQNTVEKMDKDLSQQQREQAAYLFEQLKGDVEIAKVATAEANTLSILKPIKRVAPKFPQKAAKNGLIGYVTLRILVDEKGKVATINILDSHPDKVFDKSSIRAVEKWQFESLGVKQLGQIRLDYSLAGVEYHKMVADTVKNNNLWQFSVMGSPMHQMALGMVFDLGQSQSGSSFMVDNSLPLSYELPDLAPFATLPPATLTADGFYGSAYLDVNADGDVVAQSDFNPEPQNSVESLVGMKVTADIKADRYFISHKYTDNPKTPIRQLRPVVKVPESLTSTFWLETAARNGNIHAQRIMAARSYKWEVYMIDQKDAEVMAWAGTRMILDGQRERGMALLEQAIAKNYQPAAEMKKQFM